MKKETLEKANALTQEIRRLEEHIESIQDPNLRGYSALFLEPVNDNRSVIRLQPELLYASLEAFMEMYLLSAKSRLEKLQKEFNDLKD